MKASDRFYQFLLSRLSESEINLILQSPDNITIVVAGRVIFSINSNLKKGKYAIQRIRYTGQKLLGRANRIRSSKTF